MWNSGKLFRIALSLLFLRACHSTRQTENVSPTWRSLNAPFDCPDCPSLWFGLSAFGVTLELSLSSNTRWLSPGYAEYELLENGEMVPLYTSSWREMKHYRLSRSSHANVSFAMLSIGRYGVMGAIHLANEVIHLEPMESSVFSLNTTTADMQDSKHTHLAYKDYPHPNPDSNIGMIIENDIVGNSGSADFVFSMPRERRKRIRSRKLLEASGSKNSCASGESKFIELLVVNDLKRYEMFGDGTQERVKATVNIADGYYSSSNLYPCIRISLVGQLTHRLKNPEDMVYRSCSDKKTTSSTEPICKRCSTPGSCKATSLRSDEFSSTALLSSFRKWRIMSKAALQQAFGSTDAVHLFTGHSLDGQIKGVAFLGTICRQADSSVGLVESRTRTPEYHAAILAHELAHNLGIPHDHGKGYLMSASTSASTFATKFSPMSKRILNELDQAQKFPCLSNTRRLPNGKQCGNGIIEPGEECDPGLEEDSCCIKCKIDSPRCKCANSQPCCQQGEVTPAGQLCRKMKNVECDFAEYCTGTTANCPKNLFRPTSATCKDQHGVQSNCFRGLCSLSRDSQCQTVSREAFSTSKACPRSSLCSQLHCRRSSDDKKTCSLLWTTFAVDGSPCGPRGLTDSSWVCLSGYCAPGKLTSNSSFHCEAIAGKRHPSCKEDSPLGHTGLLNSAFYALLLLVVFLIVYFFYKCLAVVSYCRSRQSVPSAH